MRALRSDLEPDLSNSEQDPACQRGRSVPYETESQQALNDRTEPRPHPALSVLPEGRFWHRDRALSTPHPVNTLPCYSGMCCA